MMANVQNNNVFILQNLYTKFENVSEQMFQRNTKNAFRIIFMYIVFFYYADKT